MVTCLHTMAGFFISNSTDTTELLPSDAGQQLTMKGTISSFVVLSFHVTRVSASAEPVGKGLLGSLDPRAPLVHFFLSSLGCMRVMNGFFSGPFVSSMTRDTSGEKHVTLTPPFTSMRFTDPSDPISTLSPSDTSTSSMTPSLSSSSTGAVFFTSNGLSIGAESLMPSILTNWSACPSGAPSTIPPALAEGPVRRSFSGSGDVSRVKSGTGEREGPVCIVCCSTLSDPMPPMPDTSGAMPTPAILRSRLFISIALAFSRAWSLASLILLCVMMFWMRSSWESIVV
mmetsp:Transcript_17010/g.34443  ORF Transcript_17010/g.34443 Transcript_17010/m.34443 type:complete len:285 (-) Transcript_17010:519-1373(-)